MRGEVRDDRHKALLRALDRFGAYEGVYTTGLALLVAGETEAAVRLLAWVDELVDGEGVPLPELKLVRALALMEQAADDAPWLAPLRGSGIELGSLRCRSVMPSHTPLAEDQALTRTRSASDEALAVRTLRTPRRLLDRASELGADTLVADSARACVALYIGELPEARVFRAQRGMPLSPLRFGAPSSAPPEPSQDANAQKTFT